MTNVFQNIFKTGLFFRQLQVMEVQKNAQKTYTELKIFSTATRLELCKSQTTIMGRGFQENSVLQQGETIQLLASLATAASNNYNAKAILTVTNQLIIEKLATAMESITLLMKQIVAKTNNSSNYGTTKKRNVYYCWACRKKRPHSCYYCPVPAEGYKNEATWYEKLEDNLRFYKKN